MAWQLFLLVYFYLFLQMSAVWLLYRWLKNPSVVDVSWSLGLMVAGLIYLYVQAFNLRVIIISALLLIWGLRLATYLWFSRIRKGHVDKRYLQLSANWKIAPAWGFFFNFQLQAIFIWILSSVFFFAARVTPGFSLIDGIAIVLIIIGIIGESLADWQLQHFKARSPGKVCNVGLWFYSRHPNYFFDWLSWCGFALFGVQASWGFFALISPLFLYIIFTRITGVITERGSIQARGEAFLTYQKTTPMFFPRFKR